MLRLIITCLVLAVISVTFADNESSTTHSPQDDNISYHDANVDLHEKKDHLIFVIHIGTPTQKVRVSLTTKHADLWVVSDLCTTGAFCRDADKKVFEVAGSHTLQREGITKYYYEDYEVSMNRAVDSVVIAEKYTVQNQTFGLARNVKTINFYGLYTNKNYPGIDGVLGLGIPKPEDIGKSLLDNMFDQNLIPAKLYAFRLSKPPGGLLLDFKINPEYYKGALSFVYINSHERFRIKVDHFLFGGDKWVDAFNATIQESYSIAMPELIYNRFMFATLGIPCSSFPAMNFVIGGLEYLVHDDHYVYQGTNDCYVKVIKSKNDEWILGIPFLSSFYTVFDIQNRRIGLALKNYN